MAEKYDVTIDRDKYIGGSDIPIIMGLSKFKTRWQLLQEKSGILTSDFKGNKYTEYGHRMEIVIRDEINRLYGVEFDEDMRISGVFRYHADGYDPQEKVVLEVKTTSETHASIEGYKQYLVQLLKGMEMFKARIGMLAVYSRPDDMSEKFDIGRLQIFNIYASEYKDTLKEIHEATDKFIEDWEKLKANPFTDQESMIPASVVDLAKQVTELEDQLLIIKPLEEKIKTLKELLKSEMDKYGVDSWELPNGTKVTVVAESSTTKKVFNEKKFSEEHSEMYLDYLQDKVTSRKGYVRITPRKEK